MTKSIGEHEHLIHLQVFHFINSKAKSLSDYFLWFYTLVLAFNALCPWLWLSLYIGWRQSQVLLLSLAPAPSLSKKLAWEQQKGFKTDNILLYFTFQSAVTGFKIKYSFLSLSWAEPQVFKIFLFPELSHKVSKSNIPLFLFPGQPKNLDWGCRSTLYNSNIRLLQAAGFK